MIIIKNVLLTDLFYKCNVGICTIRLGFFNKLKIKIS